MDLKLKKYLEKEFSAIRLSMATKKDIANVKIELKGEISEILEVVNNVSENTSKIIERMDDDLMSSRERIDNLSRRVDFLQDQIKEIKKEF